MRYTLALAIAIVILGGVGVLFFTVAEEPWREAHQSSLYRVSDSQPVYTISNPEDLAGASSLVVSASSYQGAISVLDNDLDNDGTYDGIADPLAVLDLGSAVLATAVSVVALVGVKLLLVPWKPSKLSSIWPQVLERPG